MKIDKKLLLLALFVCIIVAFEFVLPDNTPLLRWYTIHIYYPYQTARYYIFGKIPFSVGDVLYVAAGINVVVLLIRWVYFVVKSGQSRQRFWVSFIRSLNWVLALYILFIAGWGANYYKPSLSEAWDLQTEHERKKDSTELVAFNRYLLEKLNNSVKDYTPKPLSEVNQIASKYYQSYTDSKIRYNSLFIKSTMFSYYLDRLAIEGYYNPFTGEGQVDINLPLFMLPFVVCHEMAHQAGIAAEGDANLMAYAVSTSGNDPSFSYSGYLNLWLYANTRLYRRGSALASSFEKKLNPLILAHLDTLEQMSKLYQNQMSKYSSQLYDDYLKLHQQQEGIRSYSSVTTSAWLLEQKRTDRKLPRLHIP